MAVVVLVAALLAAVLAVGVLFLVFAIRGGRPYASCGNCRYDVSGSIGITTRCPECGALFTEVGVFPPRRRSRRVLVFSGALMLVIAATCTGGLTFSILLARAETARADAARAQAIAAQAAAQAAAAQAADAADGAASAPEDASD